MNLNLNGVSKRYGNKVALDGVSTSLSNGITALLGPNGAGKSTLMNIIAGIVKADGGEIKYCINGHDYHKAFTEEYRCSIGFMPQRSRLYPNFTPYQFLHYIAILKDIGNNLPVKQRKVALENSINSMLSNVDLEEVKNKRISELSGGMLQRLALAQACLGEQNLIILDEPTAGLDPKQRIRIRNFISKLAINRIIIIATHIVSDIESICNKIVVLKEGKIIADASQEYLINTVMGKVWSIEIPTEQLPLFENYNIVNVSSVNQRGNITCRIVSDYKPTETAELVQPNLEDYYVYNFE